MCIWGILFGRIIHDGSSGGNIKLITYILLVFTLSTFPLGWIITGKLLSEKGLFGKHSCRWLNSTCLRFGKHHVDDRWLCDNHYSQYESRKKIVFGK